MSAEQSEQIVSSSPAAPAWAGLPEHVLLQRVAVRMLHDPALRAAVYADPAKALADLRLSEGARAMLVAVDARAWGVDTHRSARVLKALLDEFPVSALALSHEGVAPNGLHAFFQSAHFHDAVMARGSLAPAFGRYLEGRVRGATARAMIALEAAIARVRRRPSAGEGGPWLVRGAAEGVALPAGSLAAWERARAALTQSGDPVARLLGRGTLPRLPALGREPGEHVLLEKRPDAEPTAAFAGEALLDLLARADRPAPRASLTERAAAEGASPEEAEEIVAELVAEGLLVAVPAASRG